MVHSPLKFAHIASDAWDVVESYITGLESTSSWASSVSEEGMAEVSMMEASNKELLERVNELGVDGRCRIEKMGTLAFPGMTSLGDAWGRLHLCRSSYSVVYQMS